MIQPNDVMVGVEPGWLTVVGWRYVEGELSRQPVTVQVHAAALPTELIPPELR